MKFDLRLPIGFLFSLFGGILAIYGAVTPPDLYAKSLGINVNLYWGVVLCAFGGVMLAFAVRSRGREQRQGRDQA
ncbi:MAG: hypothetical protein H3C62_00515 [Gemmatimonadaceae bacterium]|nr:hypothetical protein [Gemmatimonadaceae bacterium]